MKGCGAGLLACCVGLPADVTNLFSFQRPPELGGRKAGRDADSAGQEARATPRPSTDTSAEAADGGVCATPVLGGDSQPAV